jgi:uncharacterized membrane protein
MAPLIVMLVSWAAARLAGSTGFWLQMDSWSGALRVALAAMFVFTGVSHFHHRTRQDLVRMVPPNLPKPALLVTITGVVELIGAAGLLLPTTAPAAAYGMIALLVAMFPANILRRGRGSSLPVVVPCRSSGVHRCNCSGFSPSGGSLSRPRLRNSCDCFEVAPNLKRASWHP